MLDIPRSEHALIRFVNEMIEACMQSAPSRASECRLINTIVETGRTDGAKSKLNMLYNDLDRLTAYLYSPTDLRFTLDFENDYPERIYQQAAVVARGLTRDWERNNLDTLFGRGVFESLKFGASILKQWTEQDDDDVSYNSRLVSQWNFGVYTEDENELSKQEVLCERTYLTLAEVWYRIHKLPGANDLMKRIKQHARSGESDWSATTFFHQVLSVSQINTSGTVNNRPPPGGIVDLANNQNYGMMTPSIAADRVLFHELWVKGEKDYVTIQVIDPDIIIAPFRKDKVVMRMQNLMVPGDMHTGRHPYTLIQPNQTSGYIWGRPEIMDLVEPQMLLSQGADDAQRLLGVQVDKIIGFNGVDGMTDERYDQFRGAGWVSNPAQSGTMQDLTPKFPPELLPMLKFYIEQLNVLGGFSDLMQGRGESGVRAGTHANTLLKTGSPRLRDRSLLVERQCATAADLTLLLKTAKDGDQYWTKAETIEDIKNTTFRLTDLPDDRRVAVDSHSSSPIFADDHQQLIAFGLKAGFVDGEEALEDLNYPNRERKKQKYRMKQAAQKAQLDELKKSDPEAFAKLLSHGKK